LSCNELDELVNGAVTKTYTYGSQRISENQLSGSTWTPTFYGYDGHGNVRFTTSTAGAVGNTYQFDAFGAPIASTGTIANTYLYSGERFDSNLNLYHLRARYYNMLTGRFLTMDPRPDCACEACKADPLRLHKYLYAASDPVNRIDPTGRADIAENSLVLAAFFTGVVVTYYATQPQQSQAVVTSVAALGQRAECEFAKLACNLTSLGDSWRYPGRTYGANRCEECYDHCIQTGSWPSRAGRTTGGYVRCDYWNFPSQSE
jgi:RHS repeat-associated protein